MNACLPTYARRSLCAAVLLLAGFQFAGHAGATPAEPVPDRLIRVGVLSSSKEPGPNTSQGLYIKILREAGMDANAVSVEAVRNGALDDLDIFVIGGGSGTAFAKSLGEEGCKKVEAFVQRGGGALSSCAGSYAFSRGYNEATLMLEIANARCVPATDGHRTRGKGEVELATSADANPTLKMFYANGPVWEITNEPGFGVTQPLAWFRTDVVREGDAGGVMPGTPAILGGTFGDGRFVLFSAHPEFHKRLGNNPLVVEAARWAARGPLASDEKIDWNAVFGAVATKSSEAEATTSGGAPSTP